jgi:hypothetical protein
MFKLLRLRAAGTFLLIAAGLAQAGDDQRHVLLDGQSNFRDLGGYETADGRKVRWGEVFRSGRLPSLSDADVGRLESLGVTTVVNFLTPAEIEHAGADRLPEGVREIAAPIAGGGDDLALLVLEARPTGRPQRETGASSTETAGRWRPQATARPPTRTGRKPGHHAEESRGGDDGGERGRHG